MYNKIQCDYDFSSYPAVMCNKSRVQTGKRDIDEIDEKDNCERYCHIHIMLYEQPQIEALKGKKNDWLARTNG